MKSTNEVNGQKVSFGQMLGYGSAQFGFEFIYTTIGIFAMYFLTDVALIGAALAGVILLVARFWDAFADLFVGYLSDRTTSRWGKRRPYMLFGAIPLGLTFYLFFLTPSLPPDLKFIYYLVLMLLVWTLYSITNVPWAAITPSLSLDAKVRNSIVGIQRFVSMLGLIIIGGLTRPLTDAFSSPQVGWANMGLIYGLILIVFVYLSFFTTRERFTTDESAGIKFKDAFLMLTKNKPFILQAAAVLCVFIVFTATGTMLNYFFKYCLNNESLVSISFLFTFGLGAFILPVLVWLSYKIGKKAVYILGLSIYGLSFASLFFLNTSDWAVLVPLFILFAIGFSGVSLGIGTLLPDTVEYGEWKTGVRNEGLIYGVNTFILKLATSLAAIVVGLGLQMSGYVANVAQTEGSLLGIRLLTSIVPGIVCMIGVVMLILYPINEKIHAQMVSEIAERKAAVK